jgi:membrane protease YdiL (CAAX protease family)
MIADKPVTQAPQSIEREPARAAPQSTPTDRILQVVNRALHYPAAWTFAAVWLIAEVVLFATDRGSPVDAILFGLAYLLFTLFTAAITPEAPVAPIAASTRAHMRLQLGLVLLFVFLTAWRGLQFHDVVGADTAIPVWSPLLAAVERLGDQSVGQSTWLANPLMYVGLPLPVLMLAGARLSSLGFGRGAHIGRVLLLWSVVPVLVCAYVLLAGQLTFGRLAARLVNNALSNGFFEEFLFRGALQTRLRYLWGPAWAVVVQALVFGAWHLGLGFDDTAHAGWLPALASTLARQAVLGLAFGVMFERTRNLLAPSIVHVLVNSMGI